jgi:hypothetical protein
MATTTPAIFLTTTLLTATPALKCSDFDHHGGGHADGGGGGGTCATLAVVDPAVSLDGYTRFSPDEKRNNPNAGEPSYVFLAAGSEAVVIPGPDVPSAPGLFATRGSSITLVGANDVAADGYSVVVNDHLGYQVTIEDFEFEVALARVEMCEVDNVIHSNFVYRGNPGASGVAFDITATALVDGTPLAPSSTPVTVEVR